MALDSTLYPTRPEVQPWIQTTRHKFWLNKIDTKTIDLSDIAQALARIARFGGHGKHDWTVAQHCLFASTLVSPTHKAAVLLHDAAEAYIGDIVRPLKQLLQPVYGAIEQTVDQEIAKTFGLSRSAFEDPAVITADNLALYEEGVALFGEESVRTWGIPTPLIRYPVEEARVPSRNVPFGIAIEMNLKSDWWARAYFDEVQKWI